MPNSGLRQHRHHCKGAPSTRRRLLPTGIALALITPLLPPLHAQTVPDAGALRQQLEQERQPQLPTEPRESTPGAPVAAAPAQATLFDVQRIRLVGNTLLSAEQLAPVLAPYSGRRMALSELQLAAAAVASAYREAGWIVRALVPRQDVTDGTVTIQVVEARFSGVVPQGPDPLRLKISMVLGIFAAQQPVAAPLNADALDRALLLADDLPGISVAGALQAGPADGETSLVLKVTDEPLLIGDVSLSNTGSRATGTNRLGISANLNSPLGLGDLLAGNLVHSEGADYLRLDYTVPVGVQGWRVGVNASTLAYRVTAAEFSALQSRGKSDSVGLSANYPVVRSRKLNLVLQLGLDQKRNHNESNGAVQSDYAVDGGTVGLSGNYFDSLGGGGSSSFGLSYVGGNVQAKGAAAVPVSHPTGGFDKWRYFLSRQQALTEALSLYTALSGQETGQNLDSSEKFYLGGASGVRAYPASEGAGSSGQIVNLEMRWRVAPAWVLTLFRDWGQVSNYDNSASYSLAGNGISVNWRSSAGPTLQATWAQRSGANPNPTATGNDQDGSRSEQRVWLSLGIPF